MASARKKISFGVIGCGLMGREFASAAARWMHLLDLKVQPEIVAVCDLNASAVAWFERNIPTIRVATADYRDLLDDQSVDAIYCAVPHNLHEQIYTDILRAGKHLLGEKPFGIDLDANTAINREIEARSDLLVRCSSEFPFYPGPFQISTWAAENRFGRIIDVEAGFWHSSDLNPLKSINWKRRIDFNGEYGCMGDLGMHVLHLPLRYGWNPASVSASLSNVVTERPDAEGNMVPCETWDNAVLHCDADVNGDSFPMTLSMKRIAPGHANTWFIRINGTACSVEYSTKNPKRLRFLPYSAGGEQAWHTLDTPHASAYPVITAGIFEFGFSDAILQMWAAFCDELVNGSDIRQPFRCATPEEAAATHRLFTASLESHHDRTRVALGTAHQKQTV